MSSQINKTQLNKFTRLINSGKNFLDKKKLSDGENMKYTKAVTMSVLREYYNLDQATAFDSLIEGSGDNKIDGFYYGDNDDELDVLVLVQSKYKQIAGTTSTFHEDDIKLCIQNALTIMNGNEFNIANDILVQKVKSYRQKLIDADLPPVSIKLFFATNGIISDAHKNLKEVLDCTSSGIEVFFVDATEFGNQPVITKGVISVNLKSDLDKTDSIFSIDDIQYNGIIVSCSVRNLMIFYETSGKNLLLSENVRFLLKNSSINKKIKESFIDDPKRFCYLNNGISIICSKYEQKPTGHILTKIEMTTPSVVNGGQTLSSLYQVYLAEKEKYSSNFDEAKVLLRVYQAPAEYGIKIAQATNSQNPISTVDLHSNDPEQLVAQKFFAKHGLGLIVKSGTDTTDYDDVIKNEAILQIYASLYFEDPAKAKVSKSGVFTKYYSKVFNNSMDEVICKKLYRCYVLGKYVTEFKDIDEVVKKNAFYSIIYLMGKIRTNITNENIPNNELQDDLLSAMENAKNILDVIIERKKEVLGTKFSMNNLFKGSEIKDLMDIELIKNLN